MAYQIGFDLYESATQQFLTRVRTALRSTAPIPISDSTTPAADAATAPETPATSASADTPQTER